MKKTVIEKLSEIAEAIKGKFEDSAETAEAVTEGTTEKVTAEFVEVTSVDGETVLSYEGELAVGTALFIVAEGEQIPAPEGTYELGGDMAGVSLVVDAEGMISEVIDAREDGDAEEAPVEEEQAEAMSAEDVNGIVDEKMSAFTEALTAVAQGVESLLSENDSLKAQLAEFKTEFAEFKELPSAETEKKKFSRNEKPMSKAEARTANLIKQRTKKS